MTAPSLDREPTSRGKSPSLLAAALVFLRFTSPQAILTLVIAALVLRLALGGFTPWDLLMPLIVLAAQPFIEWLIHVYILHFRPRRVFGLTLDLQAAQKHRAHHRAPWQLDLIFIPKRIGLVGLVVTALGWWLLTPTVQLFATAMLATLTMALTYEWIHYLTHTNYRPKSALYRQIWRYHRLHHFKNERYWMGVTMHLGDRVLGTMPDPTTVETSATARTLGIS